MIAQQLNVQVAITLYKHKMIEINEKNHTAIVIGSLDKIYNNSKITGILRSNDVYILEAIYKLLSGCTTSISQLQKRTLISLYNTTLNTSKFACKSSALKVNDYILKSKFTQANYNDCNTMNNLQKVYYWQEFNTLVTESEIIDNVNINGYLQTKLFDTIPVFNIGKTIPFTNIGLISLAITNSLETDNYRIYDILNNDVTESFNRTYLNNKTILFVSNNIYSFGNLFIKLTKSTPFIISNIFTNQFTNQFT